MAVSSPQQSPLCPHRPHAYWSQCGSCCLTEGTANSCKPSQSWNQGNQDLCCAVINWEHFNLRFVLAGRSLPCSLPQEGPGADPHISTKNRGANIRNLCSWPIWAQEAQKLSQVFLSQALNLVPQGVKKKCCTLDLSGALV